jgi:hypothetical protein
MFRLLITFYFAGFSLLLFGQKLPDQWSYSDDGRYLLSGTKLSTGLYDENTLEEIRLYFPQTNYWTLLTQNYNSKTDIPARLRYQGVDYDSVGVRFKGQTSYFMNNSQKKSFNISMDFVKNGQKLKGYKTLNLNNSFQDASFMREVLYYRLIRKHSPAAKANFVRLYINDQDWGVYQNVQQLNKDFLEEWYESNDGVNIRADVPDGTSTGPGGGGGMWGDGTAALNYLGSDTAIYQKYYTLKSSGPKDPWQRLIKACMVLNQTPIADLDKVAPLYFDVDKILWHLACEIAFSDDDSYVYKGKMDYYLYQDAETERFATYDYDGNSVMKNQNVSWSVFYNEQKVNYPLLNKLLKVPAYRQRYLAHMRTIARDLMDPDRVNQLITQYDNLIRQAVFADPKKTTSNNAYTTELNALKNFINNRRNNILSNAEVNVTPPVVTNAMYNNGYQDWGIVKSGDNVIVSASITHPNGIKQANVFWGEGLSGLFVPVSMNDEGKDGDQTANDGVYSAMLPKSNPGILVKFYIEAVANNPAETRSYFPPGAEHELMYYKVSTEAVQNKTLVINEFMASNTGIVKDEFGDNDDWIELYNTTGQDIDMSGYYISDKLDNPTKFKFANGVTIPAFGYLIVWADENGSQGPLHANFKLSADGEAIILSDNNLNILDSLTFGPQVTNKSAARKPNGTGNFVIGDHTFNKNNDSTSATEEQEADFRNDILLFPNPTSQTIFIQSLEKYSEPIYILDITGQQVLKFSGYNASTGLDISTLQQGIYLLKAESSIEKFVILR